VVKAKQEWAVTEASDIPDLADRILIRMSHFGCRSPTPGSRRDGRRALKKNIAGRYRTSDISPSGKKGILPGR
jgi:hypothetical protein